MTHPAQSTPPVEVMWRPGCRFCRTLRRGLRRAGVVSVEYDIWSCVDAVARVRAATGGNETVPTVFVGPRALVNPTVDQVLAALKSVDPSYAPTPPDPGVTPAGRGWWSGRSPGLIWTFAVAVVWVLLVLWRPTTTWHLAPPLMAAAWPWVVGQDLSRSDPKARRAVLTASAGALSATVGLTAALASAGRLAGPTWTGAGTPAVEALALAGAATLLATVAALLRTLRPTTTASARLGPHTVAFSEDVISIEGNAYFPLDCVPQGVLQPSSTTSICPWKGLANCYDVHIDDRLVPDGAWTYRHPLPLARRVKGRVAFWNGIEVDRT